MTHTDTNPLWKEFTESKSQEMRRQLAMAYLGVVRFVVSKFRSYAKPAGSVVDEQDLMQLGMIGLLDAIDRFDPSRGVKFETYAITRIRGTIQDELRRLDWVPRTVREKVRKLDRALQKIECNDILSGTVKKIATDLSMSVDDYVAMLHDTQTAAPEIITRDDSGDNMVENLPDGEPTIADKLADDQIKTMILGFVENLPQHDRLVISLYYYEELTFKEIANVLRLSESRVFQKHQVILEHIREQITELV